MSANRWIYEDLDWGRLWIKTYLVNWKIVWTLCQIIPTWSICQMFGTLHEIKCTFLQMIALVDLRGAWGMRTPLGVEILSISCSFWEMLAKLYVSAPWKVIAPTSGKSRIRHWLGTLNKSQVVCNVDVWNYILNKPTWLIIQMFGTLRLNFLSFKKTTITVMLVTMPTEAIALCTIPMVFVPVAVSSVMLFIILVALVNVSFECVISFEMI